MSFIQCICLLLWILCKSFTGWPDVNRKLLMKDKKILHFLVEGKSIERTWVSQRFCNILLSAVLLLMQFNLWQVPAMVGRNVVVGALTHCALLHSMCELMLYKFKLSQNDVDKKPKNICCVKGEDVVDNNRVTRLSKKFCLGCKNPNISEGQVNLASHHPQWLIVSW